MDICVDLGSNGLISQSQIADVVQKLTADVRRRLLQELSTGTYSDGTAFTIHYSFTIKNSAACKGIRGFDRVDRINGE